MQKEPIIIAGPCAMESYEVLDEVAQEIVRLKAKYNLDIIFKSSFDKANRTKLQSFRGVGLVKGMQWLADIKQKYGFTVTTDIHEAWQAERVAEVVDVIQIPAFLCRQTDLLLAAARTGKIVNVKKAQFLSGDDMIYPIEKLSEGGCKNIWATERGNMFGYGNVVVDFRNLERMHKYTDTVLMDCTHSVVTSIFDCYADRSRQIKSIALAAKAFGADGYFFEVHPTPCEALCDANTMLNVYELGDIVGELIK